MAYKIVIAEDERLSADLLKTILSEINQQSGPFEILSICHSGEEAVEAVKKYKPDILFLDVNMPQGDGFSVVNALHDEALNIMPSIIFTTAHSHFAARAFDVEAADYLLKPLSNEKVARAVARVRKGKKLDGQSPVMIKVPMKNGSEFISADNIYAIEASGDYIYIYSDNRRLMIRGALRDYVEKLQPQFYQTHRSYLVNLDHIVGVNKKNKGTVSALLNNGKEFPVSRRFRTGLLKSLPNII